MSNTKRQSSVEWLSNEIFNLYETTFMSSSARALLTTRIRQAKEMHRQEIEDAHIKGSESNLANFKQMGIPRTQSAQKYYNEVYGDK